MPFRKVDSKQHVETRDEGWGEALLVHSGGCESGRGSATGVGGVTSQVRGRWQVRGIGESRQASMRRAGRQAGCDYTVGGWRG